MGFLLIKMDLADLGVGEDTDDRAVLLEAVQVLGDGLTAISVLLGVVGKGLLLGLVPVLVETTLDFIGQMLSPDSAQSTKTLRSLNVTHDTDNNNGRGLDDSDSFDNFLLVEFGARTIGLANNVGHASLITHEGSHVHGLSGVILGEGLDLSTVASGTLAGQESEMAVSGSFELAVRLITLV